MTVVVALLLVGRYATSARAQQTPPANPTATVSPQELAKSVHNPFEDFLVVPVQSTTGFNIGPHRNAGESLNFQPLIPVALSREWDLFVRPSISVNYQPSPHEQYGLGDLQASFFLSSHKSDVWIWGVGPIIQAPTATSKDFGTGRWSGGPTAVMVYSKGPWFDAILAYQLMSVAGDRDRGSVNETYVEPEVSYNTETGWYFDIDPPMTFDWTADAANGWTIPMGADVGKVFTRGSRAIGFQIGVYDLIKRPADTPQWIIRMQVTAMFPTGW